MGLTDVKKELSQLEKSKLIEVILELYKKNKSVKEYFDYYVNPDEIELFRKYQQLVLEAFFPKRGYQLKLIDARKAISEFKNFEPSGMLQCDLMLFYVETGVRFTRDYGDIDEAFYVSVEGMFKQALTLMKKEKLLDEFQQRAEKVLIDTKNIGWGFHDQLIGIYLNFYPGYDGE